MTAVIVKLASMTKEKKVDGGPRDGMIRAAAELLSERGLAGASFSCVLERSGAPRGSIYHHFPEGKDELAARAIELVGARVEHLVRTLKPRTPAELTRSFVAPWRELLLRSDFAAGCAIAAVANERLAVPALAERAAAVFASWEAALVGQLVGLGVAPPEARAFATLVLASLEGALVLCRANGNVAALDRVETSLVAAAPGESGHVD
ncbi:MAG: TetR/AcrR family transcriptional regulator [Polyangiaceae bacterium]|jgi:TetR/AcrR family transcriptional regulator, lmrAB and yxaGH operons repressor|nr:TetR/AcrR family transcriptional regulator [Polyangiaceae bacterium]